MTVCDAHDGLEKSVEKLFNKMDAVTETLSTLRGSMRVWGSIFGFIVIVVAPVITAILLRWLK